MKSVFCRGYGGALCNIVQDFAASIREHVKNTGTKPVQADPPGKGFWSPHKRKNPGSAATETGIKSDTKASSSLQHNSPEVLLEAIDKQLIEWVAA